MYSNSVAGNATVVPLPLKLLLVDDHCIVREGLRALLDDGEEFVIVGEAGNGAEACDAVRSLLPDIVLTDLKMPGMAISDAIHMMRTSLPSVRVIALTGYAEDAQIRNVMAAGAAGYVLKDVTKSELVTALRAVACGKTWLHPLAQRSLVEQLRNRQMDPIALLTHRERSVLDLIGRGMSNRQIGDELRLSEGTVKGYVGSVLAKLKLADRTQAALFSAHRGSKQR